MNRHDNPYNLFPKDKFYVRLHHMAPGMVVKYGGTTRTLTKKDCGNSKFLSVLEVRPRLPNGEIDWDAAAIHVTAKCSASDTPSREQGRAVLRLKAQAQAEVLGYV